MDERSRQRQFEEQFVQQLRARARLLTLRRLPADQVQIVSVPDGVDAVRATIVRLGQDRGLLEQLPGTRAIQLDFQRRVFGPMDRNVARLRAQVLAPLEELIEGKDAGPVGHEQVLDALARYDLLPRRERPTAAVFASATGFTDEAKALAYRGDSPTLVLMSAREDGGWDVEMPERLRRSAWAALFDLESQSERVKRLRYHLDKNEDLLESRGVSVPELAEELGLPAPQVEDLVRQACRNDTRLMTVVHEGTVHVCRSPLPEEGAKMSLMTWIRRLLRMKPTIAEQVRTLTAQRVQLEQQRHDLDRRLDQLETEERKAVETGAAAKTDVERKQIAGRLVRTRRHLRRVRAQADVFNQQIDILGTHIHHLTLAQQGRQVQLPKAEELTEEAAQAEQIMAELSANADLAASIEVGGQSEMMDDEEEAILNEFRKAAQEREGAEPAESSAEQAPAHGEQETPGRAGAEAPRRERDERARPEMG